MGSFSTIGYRTDRHTQTDREKTHRRTDRKQ